MATKTSELKDGIKTYYAKNQKAWRSWLEKNHAAEKSVWLIMYKKQSATPSVYYSEAVDEALCFGWIDSKPNKRDENSYYQFFAKRSLKSNWSTVNKKKIEKLLALNLIAPAGLKAIEIAQKNGTWTALDHLSSSSLPADLQQALDQNKTALQNFTTFPPSVKRGILEWIGNAKRLETRNKRIQETVEKAARNIRAQFDRGRKKEDDGG